MDETDLQGLEEVSDPNLIATLEQTQAQINKGQGGSATSLDKQRETAKALLASAGVDLQKGVDPITPLIKASTSGWLQHKAAEGYGAVTGDATSGMENIARLSTIVSDMTLQLTGGSLGNQISDGDRKFIMERVGNLADPEVPASQRLAAWEQVKERMKNLTVVPGAGDQQDGQSPPSAKPDAADIHFGDEPGNGGNPFNDQQKALFDAWTKANPNATADQLRSFVASLGIQGDINAEDLIKQRDKLGYIPSATDARRGLTPEEQATVDQHIADTGVVGAGVAGAGDVLTGSFMDEAGAAVDAVTGALQGEGSYGDLYDRNVAMNRALVKGVSDEHPVAYVGGQLLGGLAIPLGYEKVGYNAGVAAMREARAAGVATDEALQAGRAAAAKAVRNRMIRDGAVIGGAHGAGGGEDLGGRVMGAVGEGAVGAAGGAVFGVGGELMAPRAAAKAAAARSAPMTDGQKYIAAADRLGIEPFAPDAGGARTRRAASAVSQTVTGSGPIVTAAQRVLEQGKAVRDRIAGSLGEAANTERAGEAAISGAKDFVQRSSNRIGRIYDIASAKAGDLRIPLTRAKAALDDQIARLKEVPGGSAELNEAETLRSQLDGEFTVQGIRDMRTELFVGPDFRGTPRDRRLKEIVNAAAEDIHDGLVAAGKGDAARAFRTADDQWKARLSTIEHAIEPIIGRAGKPKSGEEVIRSLETAAKGNGRRFEEFLKTLPDDEASMVRATLASRLGEVPAARQGAEGEGFSLATFLTHWNDMSERSKAAVFGPESRAALNDLARVADGAKEAMKYANHSNSGGAWSNIFLGALALPTSGGSLLVPYITGRAIASPRFARWLAKAPAKIDRPYIEKLGRIAKAEPAIAADLLGIQRLLSRVANDNLDTVVRAAASGDRADAQGESANQQ